MSGARRTVASALAVLLVVGAAGCRERAARLMGVVDGGTAAPPEPRAEEPNQIHFTFTSPTSVTFFWRGSNRSMRVWSKEMAPRTIEAHAPTPAPFSTPGLWQVATVTDLSPGTEYGYEVGHPKLPVPSFFRTPPTPGTTPFTFVAIAGVGAAIDFHDLPGLHRLVALSEPDFVLGLGDLTFADIRSQASVDRHFEDVMQWSRKAAYMPLWGEHEWATSSRDDLRNYKGRFALPNAQTSPGAPAAGCCGQDWYWFDHGNIRFISYPEPYADGTLTDWAAKAEPIFAAAEANGALEVVVTMGHRAAYSSAADEAANAPLRKLLDGFGAKYRKYALDLAGHGFAYERSKPIGHVVHIVVPVGGGELTRADTPCGWPSCKPPATTAFRAIHHGLLRFTARPRGLKVEAFCSRSTPGRDDIHCADGEIFDHVMIEPPPLGREGGFAPLAGSPRR
jgi:hypothetical protein